jgi:hypothetical protein
MIKDGIMYGIKFNANIQKHVKYYRLHISIQILLKISNIHTP